VKKRLIVVSISAIVLLIIGSLSNVVGYQSVKSSVYDSPLFQTRTLRATNQQKNIIKFKYLGQGLNELSFPLRDTRMEQTKRVIEIIQKMDDNEFNRLQKLILSRFCEQKNNIDIDVTKLASLLKQIKSHTKDLKIILIKNGNNTQTDPPTLMTAWEGCCNTLTPSPLCIVLMIFVILFFPVLLLLELLTVNFMCD
jgi:hypothetical protein